MSSICDTIIQQCGRNTEMERENGDKALRVLSMYQKLMNNQIVNKEEAAAYGVNSRTIQRDIDDIRGFLETTDSAGISKQIVYDQKERGYRLEEVWSVTVVFEEQRIPQKKTFVGVFIDKRIEKS